MSDAVLGVSMTPTSVRTVLVAGAKADGVAVNHGNFDIPLEIATDRTQSSGVGGSGLHVRKAMLLAAKGPARC